MYILEAVWFFTYPVFLVAGRRGGFKGTAKLTADELEVNIITLIIFLAFQFCLILIGAFILPSTGLPEPIAYVDGTGVAALMVFVIIFSFIQYFLPLFFSALVAMLQTGGRSLARIARTELSLGIWWLMFLALVLIAALRVSARGW